MALFKSIHVLMFFFNVLSFFIILFSSICFKIIFPPPCSESLPWWVHTTRCSRQDEEIPVRCLRPLGSLQRRDQDSAEETVPNLMCQKKSNHYWLVVHVLWGTGKLRWFGFSQDKSGLLSYLSWQLYVGPNCICMVIFFPSLLWMYI